MDWSILLKLVLIGFAMSLVFLLLVGLFCSINNYPKSSFVERHDDAQRESTSRSERLRPPSRRRSTRDEDVTSMRLYSTEARRVRERPIDVDLIERERAWRGRR